MRNDSIVQTSCKRTDLATLAAWFEIKGIRIRSMAELVRLTIEGMVGVLEEGGFEAVKDPVRATEVLRSLGLADSLNPQRRFGKNLFKNILDSDSVDVIIPAESRTKVKEIDSHVKEAVEKWG